MASNEQHHTCEPACPICLETTALLKVMKTCKHAFCIRCLRKYLKKEDIDPDRECLCFRCPTCLVECPLPPRGVSGLMYNTEDEHCSSTDILEGEHHNPGSIEEEQNELSEVSVSCQRCLYKSGADIEASHFCEECGNLHFCADCILAHRQAKATKNHVVVILERGTKGRKCKQHKRWIKHYCSTCSTSVCQLCIVLDHGDHELQEFEEAFEDLFKDVVGVKEEIESRSNYLKECANELKGMRKTAANMKTTLINKIESHVERCVEEIIRQKETLKEKVKRDFKDDACANENLDKIPGLVEIMKKYVAKADRLLKQASAERCPRHMQALSDMSSELQNASKSSGGIDREAYLTSYTSYWQSSLEFVRGQVDFNIGTLTQRKNLKPLNVQTLQVVFEKELEVDDKAKYIPCVANLGDIFAVAQPTLPGKPSVAIDIYNTEGVLLRTFKESVRPFYDIVSTFDDKLVTLAVGTSGVSCCVQVFDPDTKYIMYTIDLATRGPLALAVNMFHQYVVLSNDHGRRMVTIHDNDSGSILISYLIESTCDIKDAFRISCSGMYIHIMGSNSIHVYEQNKKTMVLHTTSKAAISNQCKLSDISAIPSEEVYFCFNWSNSRAYFGELTLNDTKLANLKSKNFVANPTTGADSVSRLCAKGNYMVTSQGHTLRVYRN